MDSVHSGQVTGSRSLNSTASGESEKWRKGEAGDEYICDLEKPDLDAKPSKDVFWQISIQKGTNKGKIMYGRI